MLSILPESHTCRAQLYFFLVKGVEEGCKEFCPVYNSTYRSQFFEEVFRSQVGKNAASPVADLHSRCWYPDRLNRLS